MASLTVWPDGRRVAALRRTVRRLAETALPGWRWSEPDDVAGLTNELNAITTRLRDRLDELTEERDRAGQIWTRSTTGCCCWTGRAGCWWPTRPPGRGSGCRMLSGRGSRPSGCSVCPR